MGRGGTVGSSSAYNFFPCQSTGESPFVLMFGRDPDNSFCEAPRAGTSILGRQRRPPEIRFVEEVVLSHGREHKKSKKPARSRRSDRSKSNV